MEILIFFIIISAIDKIFKTKKDQKNIQEARKKRMDGDLQQGQTGTRPQGQRPVQPQSQRPVNRQGQKPKTLAEKLREEIEKGYRELENSMDPKKAKNIEVRPTVEKAPRPEKDKRFITDYDRPYDSFEEEGTLMGKAYNGDRYASEYEKPYETHSGVGSQMGKAYKGDRYIAEYDKPYETHGRKTGSQEGKSYKKREEDFYTRREKEIPILDKESGISMKNQILTGIIYSEILGEPKSRKNMKRSI